MVRRALKRVCPELVANAEQHAAGITKIGLNDMFESVEVPSEEEPSVLSRGGLSSGGGTRTTDNFTLKNKHSQKAFEKKAQKKAHTGSSHEQALIELYEIWQDLDVSVRIKAAQKLVQLISDACR